MMDSKRWLLTVGAVCLLTGGWFVIGYWPHANVVDLDGDAKAEADDAKELPSFGQIRDSEGALIYKVHYGYDKETGQLIAEQMYDARVKNYFPDSIKDKEGKQVEMPVRRIYYFYDAQGNQSKVISLVPRLGKTASETFKETNKPLDLYRLEPFGPKSSANPGNLFDKKK